jgi:hypothetical protein
LAPPTTDLYFFFAPWRLCAKPFNLTVRRDAGVVRFVSRKDAKMQRREEAGAKDRKETGVVV